jgi:hypothetical protein
MKGTIANNNEWMFIGAIWCFLIHQDLNTEMLRIVRRSDLCTMIPKVPLYLAQHNTTYIDFGSPSIFHGTFWKAFHEKLA